MNAEYFAQQMEAEALLAKDRRKYEKFQTKLMVAVGTDKTEFSVTTDGVFPQEVLDALDVRNIHFAGITHNSDDSVTTEFDISELGDYE
ncbi:hypothetical protein [Levilactobacillus enshiensis]|uniref:hypothetical protein n=1 Tax=Levilactobacillus enshiensis TaxID=2590213 RepID=UPI00117AF4D0|nr:hypothetical protein [Levilactobacillus enshiensis]